MNIDYVTSSRHAPFLPSGTNPLYTEPEKIKPKRAIRIEPIRGVEKTNYSRDATKRTIEKGRNIDLLV